MCKAFDDYKEEGKREGMQEMAMMIRNLMKNQKVTFEVAAEMTGISKRKTEAIKKFDLVNKNEEGWNGSKNVSYCSSIGRRRNKKRNETRTNKSNSKND